MSRRTGRRRLHQRRTTLMCVDVWSTAVGRTHRCFLLPVCARRWNQVARTAPHIRRNFCWLNVFPLFVLYQFIMSNKNAMLGATAEIPNTFNVAIVLTCEKDSNRIFRNCGSDVPRNKFQENLNSEVSIAFGHIFMHC